ncbi:Glycoside hydrolase superfamily,Glycosyl hydrolases family 1, N-terminal conserved site,Glycoside [Cinara cedri]|uniref:Glycoside hydrolase superfamily,Glycosyl hydrolases family 1, N-terminal conserved site,Glycoside n=1 Tax=Cinara cedri TaxID=506608 RepID=A0A5E4MWP9_9HEMI|nr:Glycoside hydrolase superfamily,Glycosyl hydrolases family 1, N-terminal conserved site,Glycoside [Cinara cedri]
MSALKFIVILTFANFAYCDDKLVFPENFLFGAGSSAYQVEGGWNASGKTESIWDDLCHYKKHLMFSKNFILKHNRSTTLDPTIFYGPQKISKTQRIDDFMEMWLEYEPSVQNSVLYSSTTNGSSQTDQVVKKTAEEEEIYEVLQQKPQVVGYYKGVPIYEELPEKLLRRFLQLPTAEEVPSEVLYTMYSVTDPDVDSPTGDIACDSYNKIDEDVQLLKDLGAKVYRFSLSWTRLYPKGNSREFNQAGIDYYNNLIDKLLENKIQPFVTIHHFDLPRHLQLIGGWSNPVIVNYFKIYADFVFNTFGDRVKLWTTINEPTVATEGYKSYRAAPAFGQNMSGVADYLALHNIIIAHASVYRLYESKYQAKQKGKISINVAGDWYFANDKTNQDDEDAVERVLMFTVGIILHPLTYGDYPEIMRTQINEVSDRLNISSRRLQEFSAEEKKLITGSYDFISLNHYMTFKVSATNITDEHNMTLSEIDAGIKRTIVKGEDLFVNNPWFKTVPEGMSSILRWIDTKYKKPEIMISENGYPEIENIDLAPEKLDYHYGHLNHILKAIKEYQVNVTGYCVWSLMDSMEWLNGYKLKYGIFHVDFNDINRKRSKKKITNWFMDVFKNHTLVPPPKNL